MGRPKTSRAAIGAVVAGGALVAAKLALGRRSSRDRNRRFRLAEGERVPDGIARVARGQLDTAIESLERRGGDGIDAGVHEARKSLKRLRAIVRLARYELGDETYRRENRVFRDAGRKLAGARDSQVMLETLDAIVGTQARYGRFREALADEADVAHKRLQDSDRTAEVLTTLREARKRVPGWPLKRQGLGALAPGFERIYKRGRRAHSKARKKPNSENLHELRKRAKDLWYTAQVLRPASPKRMKRLARRAHHLSDLIGEEHDLAVLARRVRERPADFDDKYAASDLLAVLRSRRKKLRKEALRAAKRLYCEKPRAVVRLL